MKRLLHHPTASLVLLCCVILLVVTLNKKQLSADPVPLPETLYGTWQSVSVNSGTRSLRRVTELENQYGFVIRPNGGFVERKNVGFCGTPPISYGDFQGTWNLIEDSKLAISVDFWGGRTEYIMKVKLVKSDLLEIEVMPSNLN